MFVHFPTMYKQHWVDISNMIIENYHDDYYGNCVVLAPNLTYQSVPYFRKIYSNSKIIAYNLEPLLENHWHSPNLIVEAVKHFDDVWDYDLKNIEYWNKLGINAKFKPLQYTNSLKTVKNVKEPDIDVLFFGSMSRYRQEFLSNLTGSAYIPLSELELQQNVRYMFLFQVWGKLKDELTSRAKIILNLAPYKGAHQQQTRIFHDLINNKCVLSERASYNYFDDLIIEFDGYNDCAAKMRYLLIDDKWKNHTNYSFKDYCDTKYKGIRNNA